MEQTCLFLRLPAATSGRPASDFPAKSETRGSWATCNRGAKGDCEDSCKTESPERSDEQSTSMDIDLPPPTLATTGQRIKWARQRCGLSAAALARQLGVTRGAAALWSNPRTPSFPYRHLQKLSEILGVRVEWLVTGQGEALRESSDARQDRTPLALIGTQLVGIAEAEVWREGNLTHEALMKLAQPDLVHRLGPEEVAGLRPFAFQVQGHSVSRTIAPGGYALCVDYRQMRPSGPQSGDLVIVRKCRGAEHKILAARLHGRDPDWELRYESFDPRWQRQGPMRLSADLSHDLTDDSTIEVLGFIFAVLHYDPQPLGSS